MSPYNIFDGNPIYYVDPSGADSRGQVGDGDDDDLVDESGGGSNIPSLGTLKSSTDYMQEHLRNIAANVPVPTKADLMQAYSYALEGIERFGNNTTEDIEGQLNDARWWYTWFGLEGPIKKLARSIKIKDLFDKRSNEYQSNSSDFRIVIQAIYNDLSYISRINPARYKEYIEAIADAPTINEKIDLLKDLAEEVYDKKQAYTMMGLILEAYAASYPGNSVGRSSGKARSPRRRARASDQSPLGASQEVITKATNNVGRIDHAGRHLIERGIITANPGSKLARAETRQIIGQVLENPIKVFDRVTKRGSVNVTTYVGQWNGRTIFVNISKQTVGKVKAGDIHTAGEVSSQQALNWGIK